MLIEKSANGWELHTISNGDLSCDNDKLEPDDIDKIEEILQQEFGNRIKEENLMVSWDNWSGVFIMQMLYCHSESANVLIREIYEFFSSSDNFL